MSKAGMVTIVIEPHIFEATMYTIKGNKPRQVSQPQQVQQPTRPIIQYGPANGQMPPPATPAASTPPPGTPASAPYHTAGTASSRQTTPQAAQSAYASQAPPAAASPAPASASPSIQPAASSQSQQSNVAARPSPTPKASPTATPASQAPPQRPSSNPPKNVAVAPTPSPRPANQAVARPPATGAAGQAQPARPGSTAPSPGTPTAKPATNDPVIALLAQKASGDPELRDLMKRVAVGQAKDGELAHFQKIIDQLNAEYKRKGGQQGPSADRLLVDGRTVKYFADEVRTILDIVLASNPNQKSTELKPPPRSDPLVVLLVKTALEDQRTKDMIKRIAEGRAGFTDATDLKEILDRLHRDAKTAPQNIAAQAPGRQITPNGASNGQARPLQQQQQPMPYANQQTIRSKPPPPSNRPEIAGVVFDFGTGDRYRFPKYSILEYLPTTSGQQVIASFLIVRKGSESEYGGDPSLDYYQPVTIRLQTQSGRHLENLARVVAHQDEVRRYMDDVMDNMTRAEYVLLAMRLPRTAIDPDDSDEEMAAEETDVTDGPSEPEPMSLAGPGVLWSIETEKPSGSQHVPRTLRSLDAEDEAQEKYQRLVRSVAEKKVDYV